MTEHEKTTPAAPAIYTALSAVMADMDAVGKDGWNADQKFKFRAVDDVMNAAHKALTNHGVIITPRVTSRMTETRQTKSGSGMNVVSLEVAFRFYATDGSYVESITWGEGADTADKATNKAMAQALKYALLQTLMVPTADMPEGDADHPEATGEWQPTTDPEWLRDMIARVDAATTTSQLKEIWEELGQAHEARRVAKRDADQLADRMKKRNEQIANRAPTPAANGQSSNPAPDPWAERAAPADQNGEDQAARAERIASQYATTAS